MPVITLGVDDVSPLDQAVRLRDDRRAGHPCRPYLVARVETQQHDVVYKAHKKTERVFDADVMADTTYAMTKVLDCASGGTACGKALTGRPAAGKTGTNGQRTGNKDAWFIGFTPQLSTAVWYGNHNRNDPVTHNGAPLYGGDLPAAAWQEMMNAALAGQAGGALPAAGARRLTRPTLTPTTSATSIAASSPTPTPTSATSDAAGLPTQSPPDSPTVPPPSPSSSHRPRVTNAQPGGDGGSPHRAPVSAVTFAAADAGVSRLAPSRHDPVVARCQPAHRRAAGRARPVLARWYSASRPAGCDVHDLLLGFLQKSSCRTHPWSNDYQYTRACYTDVFVLYTAEARRRRARSRVACPTATTRWSTRRSSAA